MKRYVIIAVAGLLLVAVDIARGQAQLDLAAAAWVIPPLVLFAAGETTVWAVRRRRPGLAVLAVVFGAVAGAVWWHGSAQPNLAIGGVVLVAIGGLVSGWTRSRHQASAADDEQVRVPTSTGRG